MVSEIPTQQQPKRQDSTLAAALPKSVPELKAKAAAVVESITNSDVAKKSKEFVGEKVSQVSTQTPSSVLMQALSFVAGQIFSLISFALALVPEPAKKWFEKRIMTDNRDIFLCICILPISVLYDLFWRFRRIYLYQVKKTRTRSSHLDRVKNVQDQIRGAPKDKAMCTARPGWLAMSFREGLYKNHMARIDVSQLDNVLDVNEETQTVFVEPNCSMGQVTRELIPRGWTLAVVPELDDLTVGGLINGFGIETSSHKYGLFQHTCVAYEIVLPTGELVRATATANSELFAAIPFSHGTLGFLVGAEIKIVPALPFVQMTYLPCHTLDSMVSTFTYASRSPDFDFVELLTYSKDTGVVMVGKMVEYETVQKLHKYKLAHSPRVNSIGKYWKPWFFKYVESYLSKNGGETVESVENFKKLEYLAQLYSSQHLYLPNAESKQDLPPLRATELKQDLIPLRDYYHRHTKAIFWELQDIIPFGNEPWFRYALGWAVPPQVSMLKLTTTDKLREIYSKAHVIQDLLVPINTLRNSILKFHEELECYPLWVCPMRLLSPPSDKWANTKPANIDPALPDITSQLNGDYSDARLLDDVEYPLSCPSNGGMVNPTGTEQLYVDIGAYGIPRARQWEPAVRKAYGDSKVPKRLTEVTQSVAGATAQAPVDDELHIKVMRRLEDFVRKNHGFQALYADCFQSRKEFREMFDHRLLDRLRNKYGCVGRLPDVFDKVSHEARR